MKKRIYIIILASVLLLSIVGFFIIDQVYENSTKNQIFSEQVETYQNKLSAYNAAVDEYNTKLDQYNTELNKYNTAVEADKNKEEVPADGIIKVDASYSIISLEKNHVGNSWGYVVKVNGNQVNNSSTEININEHDPLTVYVEATENDTNPDTGTAEETISYTNQEIINGINKDISVDVSEDSGRYTDNTAHITVTLTAKRVIDQVVIPDEPTKPEEVSIEEPTAPDKDSIAVTVGDIVHYNDGVKIYTGIVLFLIIGSAALLIYMIKLKKPQS